MLPPHLCSALEQDMRNTIKKVSLVKFIFVFDWVPLKFQTRSCQAVFSLFTFEVQLVLILVPWGIFDDIGFEFRIKHLIFKRAIITSCRLCGVLGVHQIYRFVIYANMLQLISLILEFLWSHTRNCNLILCLFCWIFLIDHLYLFGLSICLQSGWRSTLRRASYC